MNETLLYRQMLDSLTTDQIKALVDISEGYPAGMCNTWLLASLRERGLVPNYDDIQAHLDLCEKTGLKPDWKALDGLTDYGRAFLAWYRQPHDVPQQMRLL